MLWREQGFHWASASAGALDPRFDGLKALMLWPEAITLYGFAAANRLPKTGIIGALRPRS